MEEKIKELKELITDATGLIIGCEYICRTQKTLPSKTYFSAIKTLLKIMDERINTIND